MVTSCPCKFCTIFKLTSNEQIRKEEEKQQQQQQNFINKQINLQKYCLQLARIFEAGQCMQNVKKKMLAKPNNAKKKC